MLFSEAEIQILATLYGAESSGSSVDRNSLEESGNSTGSISRIGRRLFPSLSIKVS